MRDSSSKPRQKFQVRNYEQKKYFKKKPIREPATGLSVNVYGDDINKALRIFKKIIYDDTQEEYSSKDIKEYNNCFIKIIVANKTNATIFDRFVDKLYKEITTHEINIIEDYSEIKESIKQDLLSEAGEDTMTFLNKYIEQLNISVDKDKLKKLLQVLYSEANDSI